MNEGKVGVIAGTKVDTEMGIKEFRSAGLLVYGEAISSDPETTSNLQVLEKEKLFEITTKKINKLKKNNKIDIVCIYCNSLSTAINLEKLKKTINLPIITPLESYEKVAKEYSVIGVVAANCQAAAGIEKIIQKENSKVVVLGIGILPIVNAIENNIKPQKIIKKLGLEKLLTFYKITGIQILILGCTHFSYLKNEFEKITKIKLYDPVDDMKKRINKVILKK